MCFCVVRQCWLPGAAHYGICSASGSCRTGFSLGGTGSCSVSLCAAWSSQHQHGLPPDRTLHFHTHVRQGESDGFRSPLHKCKDMHCSMPKIQTILPTSSVNLIWSLSSNFMKLRTWQMIGRICSTPSTASWTAVLFFLHQSWAATISCGPSLTSKERCFERERSRR